MKRIRVMSSLLVVMLLFTSVPVVHATEVKKAKEAYEAAKEDVKEADKNLENAKEEGDKLKEEKAQAEAQKKKISDQLNKVLAEIEDIQAQIEAKQMEIEEKEEELFQAEVDESTQYENMKKRIRYMYETGNTQFVEILFASEDFTSFVNNVEYISTISDYDRAMLKKYQEVVKRVEEQKAALEEDYAKLQEMEEQLIKKQEEVQTLLDSKEAEIAGLKQELLANAKQQEKLEAAKKAAEEAARRKKEAEEAARRAAQAAAASAAAGAGASVISGNGQLSHPCPGLTRISSYFGPRRAPKAGASTNHKGVDFAAPTGTPIYAAAAGTVVSARYSGNAGNMVIVNHGNGMSTYYMHCSKMYVSPGQKVTKGQNIAAVGSTGNSTGPHLHFQVMVGGVAVNPLGYL